MLNKLTEDDLDCLEASLLSNSGINRGGCVYGLSNNHHVTLGMKAGMLVATYWFAIDDKTTSTYPVETREQLIEFLCDMHYAPALKYTRVKRINNFLLKEKGA